MRSCVVLLLLLAMLLALTASVCAAADTSSQLRGVATAVDDRDVVQASPHVQQPLADDTLATVPQQPVDVVEPPATDFTANAVAFARNEALGMALAGLAIFVAAGGGTGGGGILDPIYILIMKLDAKVAIPLSSITIVGGAVANLFINVRRTRKNSTEPLIDWDFILVMQPMLLMGASFGTFINAIAPTWLLCVLLVVVLTATGIRTLQKAIGAGRQEWWFPHSIGGGSGAERTQLLGATNRYAAGRPRPSSTATSSTTSSSKGRRLGTSAPGSSTIVSPPTPTANIPWRKLGALFGLFLGIVGLSLLQKVVPHASWLFTLVALLPSIFLMVFVHYSMRNVIATYQKQQNPHYVLTHDEIQWTPHSIRYFPILSIAAGMISGMFGIGGGIINGPLLLEIGIDPSAASAMTATTVLFSSAMSSFSYTMLGSLNYGFAAVMFPIGYVMTTIGHVCLLRVVQRYKCPSLIIFSMAIVVLVSAVAMSIESIKELVNA